MLTPDAGDLKFIGAHKQYDAIDAQKI